MQNHVKICGKYDEIANNIKILDINHMTLAVKAPIRMSKTIKICLFYFILLTSGGADRTSKCYWEFAYYYIHSCQCVGRPLHRNIMHISNIPMDKSKYQTVQLHSLMSNCIFVNSKRSS